MKFILSIVVLYAFYYYFNDLITFYTNLWNSYPISITIISIFIGPSLLIVLINLVLYIFMSIYVIFLSFINLFIDSSTSQPLSIDEIINHAAYKVKNNIDNGEYKAGYNSMEEYNSSNIPYFFRTLKTNLNWKPKVPNKVSLSRYWLHKFISNSFLFIGIYLSFQTNHTEEHLIIFGGTFIIYFIFNFFTKYENQLSYEVRIERQYRDYLYAKQYVEEHLASEARIKKEKITEENRMNALRKMSRRDRANEKGFDEFGFEEKHAFGYERREYIAKKKRARKREKERKRYDKHRSLERRSFTYLQRKEVYDRDNGICQICGTNVSWDNYECDHIKPWSKGGKTLVTNAQCACMSCNRSKSAKH